MSAREDDGVLRAEDGTKTAGAVSGPKAPTGIVERLRERRKLKYMADCKCGHCQLVNINDLYLAGDTIEALVTALRGVVRVADRKTVEFDVARAAIAIATAPVEEVTLPLRSERVSANEPPQI